ncbi:MAG: mismatch repair protein Vsr [Solirubrobacterales bacterium]|nr:mismatch repair protein Vsr [Solirubrobacterales bacterium]
MATSWRSSVPTTGCRQRHASCPGPLPTDAPGAAAEHHRRGTPGRGFELLAAPVRDGCRGDYRLLDEAPEAVEDWASHAQRRNGWDRATTLFDTPQPSSLATQKTMAANRRIDTEPERLLRAELHARGPRFRKDLRIQVSGRAVRPDVVFTRSRPGGGGQGSIGARSSKYRLAPAPTLNRLGSKIDGRTYQAWEIIIEALMAANATAWSLEPVRPSSKL